MTSLLYGCCPQSLLGKLVYREVWKWSGCEDMWNKLKATERTLYSPGTETHAGWLKSKGACWKEIRAAHSTSPGPGAGTWEYSRIAQTTPGPFLEAEWMAGPASLCPATSSTSHYRWASSSQLSIQTQPSVAFPKCGLCSESAGPFSLASNSLFMQSPNILIPKIPEERIWLVHIWTVVQPWPNKLWMMVLPLLGVGQGKFTKRCDWGGNVWHLQYVGLSESS